MDADITESSDSRYLHQSGIRLSDTIIQKMAFSHDRITRDFW